MKQHSEESIDSINRDKHCLNCGTPLHEGNFCHQCGQPSNTERLSLRSMSLNLLTGVTRINNRFLTTYASLLVRPWKVISEYISGKRAKYVGPVQMLVVMVFLVVSVTAILGIERQDFLERFRDFNLLSGDGVITTTVNSLFRGVVTSMLGMYIIILIPYAPILKLMHRAAGIRKFNMAEYVVAALYISCFILGLVLIFIPLRLLTSYFTGSDDDVTFPVSSLLIFAVIGIALYKSYASSTLSAVAKILNVVLNFVLCIVFYFVLMFGLLIIHLVSHGKI